MSKARSRKSDKGKTSARSIVIATPHARNDVLERHVRKRLAGYQVVRIRGKAELSVSALEKINPSLVFFPHWSWLIPREVYSSFECVIFHMTDLPYGRGGSPLQNLIVRGHTDTMISALRCVKELDAGPIYLKQPLSLAGTAEEILSRASDVMEEMIVTIVKERPQPVPQDGEIVVFKRRAPEEGDLARLTGLSKVYDHIRMLDADGYPAAFVETDNFRIEFRNAKHDGDAVEATARITGKTK